MSFPINRKAWSPSSQRSGGHYDEQATEYEGIRCRCRACQTSFVFSASDQKVAYEVKKKFAWWLPTLCGECATQCAALQEIDRTHQAMWNSARAALCEDEAFLSQWLQALVALEKLGHTNPMRIHLERRLATRSIPEGNDLAQPPGAA